MIDTHVFVFHFIFSWDLVAAVHSESTTARRLSDSRAALTAGSILFTQISDWIGGVDVDCSIHSAPCTDQCRAPVPVHYLYYWKWFCFDSISHLLRLCCLMFTPFFRIPTGTERGTRWAERAPSQLTMSRKGKESSQEGNSVLCRKYQRGACVWAHAYVGSMQLSTQKIIAVDCCHSNVLLLM